MADFDIGKYVGGFGIFLIVLLSGIFYFSGAASFPTSHVSQGDVNRFNDSFNTMNDFTGSVDTLKSSISQSNSTTFFGQAAGIVDSVLGSGWNFIKLTFGSYSFMTNTISDISDFFGVPSYIVIILTTIITALIGYGIYRMIWSN